MPKKAPKTDAAKNAPEPAKKKEAPARDKFGCREASQAGAINACITAKPKDPDAIAKECELSSARVRAHLKFLVGKGFVVEKDGSFAAKK